METMTPLSFFNRNRLVGAPERRHDSKSAGRPCKISKERQEQIRQDVSKKPKESGFERGNWTFTLMAIYIQDVWRAIQLGQARLLTD